MELVESIHGTGSGTPPSVSPKPASRGGLVPNGGDPGCRDTFHVSFDPESEPVVAVVTEAVAVIHNEDPEDLDALHEVVDLDALDDLVAPPSDRQSGADEVHFVYEGLEIVLDSGGDLWLRWE